MVASSATANQLYPISITTEPTTVQTVNAEEKAPAAKGIYDLYGNRVNLMQKGNVYIIDGMKYFK